MIANASSMSNSDGPKAKGIPSWQHLESAKANGPIEHQATPDAGTTTEPGDREALVGKAANFLEDEDIRNASRERKEFFLTLKGLNENEIRDLLKEPEAEVAEGLKRTEQQGVPKPTSSQSPSDQIEQSSIAPSKDIPPIITYPEFLLHSQKPPPLITLQRLLNTFYFATGAAATLYGTSKYVVEPMVESLTSARHSLFDTASADLDKLNEKLEKTVSKIPEVSHDDTDGSDAVSTSSDPARFFNRSAATQTSPSLSRSTSNLDDFSETTPSATIAHQARLSALHDKLHDLVTLDTEEENPVKSSLDELRRYLDSLAYANVSSSGRKAGQSDAIASMKAEIRNVKGVLLSARNFPSSVALPTR